MEKEIIKQNRIKRFKCKQEFEFKGNEFKENYFSKQQLDDQIFLSDLKINSKKKIEDPIKSFFQMYENVI